MAKSSKKARVRAKQSSTWIFWTVSGIFIACIIGIIVLSVTSNKKENIVYKGQPYIGKEDASVDIVEFGDYKCPVCKNFNETFVPKVKEKFVDTGKAKFYFMNYPFINVDSTRSALFAETVYKELGNETFWKFHELLYKKQPEDEAAEKKDIFTETFLTDTLKEVATAEQVDKVKKAFQDKKAQEALDQDLATVKKLNIDSTPTVFINGKKFTGNTMADFDKMVEEAAKEKK